MVHKVASAAAGLRRTCVRVFVCAHLRVCVRLLPQQPIEKVSCKCLKV